MEALLNVQEAAAQLGLKEKTIRQWIALRKIEYIKAGSAVRIRQSEVDRIVRSGTIARIESNDLHRNGETETSGSELARENH